MMICLRNEGKVHSYNELVRIIMVLMATSCLAYSKYFLYAAFHAATPPVSMTSPWQGIILSKFQLATLSASRLMVSVFSAIDQVNLLCSQLVGVIPIGSFPADLLFEYCSFGGRLNNRSASIKVLLSLCRKATSLFLNAEK